MAVWEGWRDPDPEMAAVQTLDSLAPRVLFVDDDPSIRTAFARSMARHGFDVDVATSVLDAVARVRKQHYPVVATDLHMPGLDGLCLIEHLGRLSPRTAFVVVTGQGDVDLPDDDTIDKNILSIVSKPWDEEELADVLWRSVRLHDGQAEPHSLEEPDSERGAAINVLLLESDEDAAQRIESDLRSVQRCDVVHVTRLRDGLEVAANQSFDVILAALSLPDARGFDVVRRLQKVVPETPIVVVGDSHHSELALHAVQLGAQDFLSKRRLDRDRLAQILGCAIERKRVERRLNRLAHFDPLTGLANRKLFDERMQAAVKRAEQDKGRVGMLFLDLDRFKSINDALGHAAGDQLLFEAAERLRSCVGPKDTVARFGGDEFAILLDSAGSSDTEAVANKVLRALRQPIHLGLTEVVTTTSVGSASYPESGDDALDLVKAADAAMYLAKEAGRNTHRRFQKQSKRDALARLELEGDLRRAISDGEFELHYQSQHCVQTKRLVGVEALLRWQKPGGTLALPDQFISTLEENGSIVAVGAWVIHRACRQLRKWHDMGLEVPRISVNVCARQFEHPGLVETVVKAVLDNGLPLGCLELEITESSLMRDVDRAVDTLSELERLGVRTSIDDFGTGYASLAYLRRFPVSALKIDRMFIEELATNHESAAIAGAIIDLGHRLGLEVVAEGVETSAQMTFLKAERCDVAQGFLFGKPAPAHVVMGTKRSATPAGGTSIQLGKGALWSLPEERPTVRPPSMVSSILPTSLETSRTSCAVRPLD